MFRQTRSQVILNALQTKIPVTGVFASFLDRRSVPTQYRKADDADRLLIRLCEIQARFSKPDSMDKLRSDLNSLDKDLREWTASTPPSWTYSEHQNRHRVGHWWDARCDIYLSTFTMHVWNKVRAARIVLHGIVRGLPPSQATEDNASYQETFDKVPTLEIYKLVTDICATIPICYRPSAVAVVSEQSDDVPRLGATYWWLLPLEIVGSVNGATPELTFWAVQCLERIFETTGIKTAQVGAYRVKKAFRPPINCPRGDF
ncbi:hypothetical protein DL98DRAFT_597924 [Cadophora sp. DSE1049]|nr:hypothetical protein DL98DRAFT_597924 [Cadophora sp. DSE1049]